MSVLNDKLLIGGSPSPQFFIYSLKGRHLLTVTTLNNETPLDATWTPLGNIAYTTTHGKVVVMSESGKVISTYDKSRRHIFFLGTSKDDVMCGFSYHKEFVYQSTDDGASWSLAFISPYQGILFQLVKLTFNYSVDYWMLAHYFKMDKENSRTYVYSVRASDYRHYDDDVSASKYKHFDTDMTMKRYDFDGDVTINGYNNDFVNATDIIGNRTISYQYAKKCIDIPTINGSFNGYYMRKLSYDGNMTIFLSDWDSNTVHAYSVTNCKYICQLLSKNYIKNKPSAVTVNKEHQLLYVGQSGGVVGVFEVNL